MQEKPMQAVNHTIGPLFDQLGLDSSETAIAEFIHQHRLADDTSLKGASFWNKAQRQFIDESWHQDSDWCELIDQLNLLLHSPH
jgi:hypothetical protein